MPAATLSAHRTWVCTETFPGFDADRLPVHLSAPQRLQRNRALRVQQDLKLDLVSGVADSRRDQLD